MRNEENIDVLLLNILRGCADEEEILFFSQWVQDEKNSQYFETIKKAWTISESLSFNVPVSEAGKEQYHNRIRRDKTRTKLRRFVLASVSVAAIGVFVYFFFNQSVDDHKLPPLKEVVAERNILHEAEDNEVTIISSSVEGDVLEVTKVSESVIKNTANGKISGRVVDSVQKLVIHTLVVPKGKRILAILSDGTKMWVNSDSEVKYPTTFPKEKRALEVVGNVYFEVAKDETRPFEVTINGIKTTALGTQFEVNNHEGEQCSIALVEGLISVENGRNKLIVQPNNYVVARVGSDKLTMSRFDAGLCGLWRENILVINNESIASIIEKLNRWHNIEIENKTKGIEKIYFTGKLSNGTLEEHLKIIADNIKIKFIKEGDKMIIWN